MIKIISKKQYHDFWKKYNGSSNQSWAWGEFKKLFGWEVEKLGIYKEDELISIVSVFIRMFPYSTITKLFGFERFAYIPRGIVVKDIKYIDSALKEIIGYFKNKELAFILIDPENNILVDEWNSIFKNSLVASGFKKSGATIQPNQTNIIRIDKSDEDLLKQIRPKWRRNIKKAKRQGVEVSEIKDNSAIDKFYSVISEVSKNTKFVIHSKDYFQKMWDELSKDGLIKIFTATFKGEVISSYLILTNDITAYEVYGGSSLKGRDLEASYLLKWEIIKRSALRLRSLQLLPGRAVQAVSGKRFYDQWGVAPQNSEDHPLTGISYFKSGFGGKYVQFLPQYVKIYNRIGYLAYSIFKNFKNL